MIRVNNLKWPAHLMHSNEPLESFNVRRPDHETLWDKLDDYYTIVKERCC